MGAVLAATGAPAHDFWIQPDRFDRTDGSPVTMTLQVGHGAERERSRIARSRITRFSAIGPDGESDLKDALDPGGTSAGAAARLSGTGIHVLVLETDSGAQSHLPADRFNLYLEEEGLTPAIALRQRTSRTKADGAEKYGRRAKAIVRIGSPSAGTQAHVTRPVGLRLEIVPEINPYELRRAAILPVRIFYEGVPLPGALVKLTDLRNDATPIAGQRTDASGRTAFAVPGAGPWLLNVVWTKPLPPGGETDFETIFSSLSFAIPSD